MRWNKKNLTNNTTSTDKGQVSEQYAQQYLVDQGLVLIEKNFHSRQGEVDLIMLDGDTYVFIEVKYRKNLMFGGAIAAIPLSKQKRIRHSISFYLHQTGLNEYNTPCRIDVVALVGDINQPQVTWLKNAF
ncbi:YraN family protein [Colwellia ponticola]|uniref:YraN family protein n=1 Tax=Colwellia ponticola TaxID=2304625 RepID=UPI001FE84F8E|nr:YraN family protein [Colwellia ponticola]